MYIYIHVDVCNVVENLCSTLASKSSCILYQTSSNVTVLVQSSAENTVVKLQRTVNDSIWCCHLEFASDEKDAVILIFEHRARVVRVAGGNMGLLFLQNEKPLTSGGQTGRSA